MGVGPLCAKVHMGTSPAAPGGRHGLPGAAAALLTATWLRLGCGACLLNALARPRPRQPSGGHHISSGSNAALPTTLSLPSPFWSKPRVRSLCTSQNGGFLYKNTPTGGNSRECFFFSFLKPPPEATSQTQPKWFYCSLCVFSGANTVARVHDIRIRKT